MHKMKDGVMYVTPREYTETFSVNEKDLLTFMDVYGNKGRICVKVGDDEIVVSAEKFKRLFDAKGKWMQANSANAYKVINFTDLVAIKNQMELPLCTS